MSARCVGASAASAVCTAPAGDSRDARLRATPETLLEDAQPRRVARYGGSRIVRTANRGSERLVDDSKSPALATLDGWIETATRWSLSSTANPIGPLGSDHALS